MASDAGTQRTVGREDCWGVGDDIGDNRKEFCLWPDECRQSIMGVVYGSGVQGQGLHWRPKWER